MKSKVTKILISIFSFVFFAFMFLFDSNDEINAASLDFYFPETIATGYNEDGSAQYDKINVYVYNNESGWNLDNKNYRIESITIEGKSIDKETLQNYSTLVVNPSENPYNLDKAYTSLLTLDIKKMIDEGKFSISGNELSFSVTLKAKVSWPWWHEYKGNMNYYLGKSYKSSTDINVPMASETLLQNYLEITEVKLSKVTGSQNKKCMESTLYTAADYQSGCEVIIEAKLNSDFQGTIKVSITTDVEGYDIPASITLTKSDYFAWSATLTRFTYLRYSRQTTLKFTTFTVEVTKAEYDVTMTKEFTNQTYELKVDTKPPQLDSVDISTIANLNEFNSSVNIDVTFQFDETVYVQPGKYPVVFMVGGKKITEYFTVDKSETGDKCEKNNSCSYQVTISGVIGKISLYSISITVKDDASNKITISGENDQSIYNSIIKDTKIDIMTSYPELVVNETTIGNSDVYFYDELSIKINFKNYDIKNINDAKVKIYVVNEEESISVPVSGYQKITQNNDNIITFNVNVEETISGTLKVVLLDKDEGDFLETKHEKLHINDYFSFVNVPEILYGYNGKAEFILFNFKNGYNTNIKEDEISVINPSSSSTAYLLCANNNDSCALVFNEPGEYAITIGKGAFTITPTGQKSGKVEKNMKVNFNPPTANVSYDNVYEREDVIYHGPASEINFDFSSSDFAINKCVKVVFGDGENAKTEEKCLGDGATEVTFSIANNFDGKLTYHTYDSEDGKSESTNKVISNPTVINNFAYIGEVQIDNLEIIINDVNIVNETYIDDVLLMNGTYNSIEYQVINNGNPLFEECEIKVNRMTVEKVIENATSGTLGSSEDVLKNLNDTITVIVIVNDKLGNTKTYNVKVHIDTVAPEFNGIIHKYIKEGCEEGYHCIYIDNTNNDIGTIYLVNDGEEKVDLATLNNIIVTNSSEYKLEINDEVGNVNIKTFTTGVPDVRLEFVKKNKDKTASTYNIVMESTEAISSIKYLVFDYTLNGIHPDDLQEANENECGNGVSENCYIIIDSPSNKLELNDGKSYLIEFTLASGKALDVIRHDIYFDNEEPSFAASPSYTNPRYVSSTSGMGFDFKFLVSDAYLSSNFKYLIAKKDSIGSIDEFEEFFMGNTCYKSSEDECVVMGAGVLTSHNASLNQYLGVITLQGDKSICDESYDPYCSAYNTIVGMKDNTAYTIYVLAEDTNHNKSVYNVTANGFINITKGPTISYSDSVESNPSQNSYIVVENGKASEHTVNSAHLKIDTYKGLEIDTLVINGESLSQSFANGYYKLLSKGTYVVEATDILGNVTKVTIYSGTQKDPVIHVYHDYNGTKYEISNTGYVYNKEKTESIFLKITNVAQIAGQEIVIALNSSSITYTSGELYEAFFSDPGVSVKDIIDIRMGENFVYDGEIMITVKSSTGEAMVTLTTDNDVPLFSHVLPGNVVINGREYLWEYKDSAWYFEFDYYSTITYERLFDEILKIKIDDMRFSTTVNIDRFKFTIDDEEFEGAYTDIIEQGEKKITMTYFDAAGNRAEPLIININCVDGIAPTIKVNNHEKELDLNTKVNLIKGIDVSDNHDIYHNLVVTAFVIKFNDEDIEESIEVDFEEGIFNAYYTFDKAGVYTIKYVVRDDAGNESSSIVDGIIVKDLSRPTIVEDTSIVTFYMYEFEKNRQLIVPIHEFEDNVGVSGYVYKVYHDEVKPENEILTNSAHYPISEGEGLFNFNIIDTGLYIIEIYAKDGAENKSDSIRYMISIEDNTAPTFDIRYKDTKEVYNGEEVNVVWKGKIPEFEVYNVNDIYSESNCRVDAEIKYYENDGVIGKEVSEITVSGKYVITYRVADEHNNSYSKDVIIIVQKDNENPIIHNFQINDLILEEFNEENPSYAKINDGELKVLVDASDDSEYQVIVNINKEYSNSSGFDLFNGETFYIGEKLEGIIYTVVVTVYEVNNVENITTKTYKYMYDNVGPIIQGVEDKCIYFEDVMVDVYDAAVDEFGGDNIATVAIFKNGVLDNTVNGTMNGKTFEDENTYTIVATDKFNNVSRVTFMVKKAKAYNVVDENQQTGLFEFDISALILADVGENAITFYLENAMDIGESDSVFILVNYPNTVYKYIICSMDGATYLSSDVVTIDGTLIPDFDNVQLLESIDNEYYAYLMVVKGEVTSAPNQKNDTSDLKTVIFVILALLGTALFLFMFIKLRRRVRAV